MVSPSNQVSACLENFQYPPEGIKLPAAANRLLFFIFLLLHHLM